jgi:dTDP-glucose 4,6-dehydratase
LLNEPLTVHGSGENTRDWIYVGDVCQALDKVMHTSLDKVKGEVINIGTGRDFAVKTIAEMILDILDEPKSLITQIGDRPGQVKRHISSTGKASRLLGWKAQTDFGKGLSNTIKWYQQNPDWWRKLLWMRHVPIKTRDGKIEYH